jgi:hypothetical protein
MVMHGMTVFAVFLMISVSVFIVPVFAICCTMLVDGCCGCRPEPLNGIGRTQADEQQEHA